MQDEQPLLGEHGRFHKKKGMISLDR